MSADQRTTAALKKHHEDEIAHHTKEPERLQKEIEQYKQIIKKLIGMVTIKCPQSLDKAPYHCPLPRRHSSVLINTVCADNRL